MDAQQPEAKQDERECSAVIEPAFTGQAESKALGMRAWVGLHARRQHRIGGRQHSAEQHGRTDLHEVFPGNARGTTTQMIAAAITATLDAPGDAAPRVERAGDFNVDRAVDRYLAAAGWS